MKPTDRLPPLSALRAFEAVARKLSFARAAEELHVTKAAVAQQVRALEQEIGAALVARSGRGLALTEAGAAGAPGLAEGFAALARAARAMREAKGRRFLVINSSPSFAATWLVARVGKFKARHPDIDVLLDANPSDNSLDPGATDALIRWGAGDFPGLQTTLLFKENVFPVCSPKLAAGENPLRNSRRLEPAYALASRIEPLLRVLADLVRLAEGGRGEGRRIAAWRLVQQHGDGDARRRAGARGGPDFLRHRCRRTRRGPARGSVFDQRENAFRLLFLVPPGGGGNPANQGVARVSCQRG